MANDESRDRRAQLQWRLGRCVVVSYPCLEGLWPAGARTPSWGSAFPGVLCVLSLWRRGISMLLCSV
jgi:hypothetical protein